MSFWANIWDLFWLSIWMFAFISYLWAVIAIFGDIFRDRELKGWAKAVWVLLLFAVPFLTALVYLIVRGGGMSQRAAAAYDASRAATDDYIRTVAGSTATADIEKAKALLDSGAITKAEYETLKAKALA
jgi:hypothetical protein